MKLKYVSMVLLSVIFLMPFAYSLIAGNLIANGDFETFNSSQSVNGYSDVRYSGDWVFSAPITGSACIYNSAGINCTIINSTNCVNFGFSSSCLSMVNGNAINSPSIVSGIFTWNSNSSWGVFNFYSRLNRGGSQTGEAINFYLLNSVDNSQVSSGSVNPNDIVTKYSINLTGFVQSKSYKLNIVYNPDGNGAHGFNDAGLIDNITLFNVNSTTVLFDLSASCTLNFANQISGYYNNGTPPYSCSTLPLLNTSNCLSLSAISGSILLKGWGNDCLSVNNDNNKTWFGYSFNSSNTFSQNSQVCNQWALLRTYSDTSNLNSYLSSANLFSTCYYYYNTTNFTIQNMVCNLDIGCNFNISSIVNNGSSCDNLCYNGFIYSSGVYSSILNSCSYSVSLPCLYGCSSDFKTCGLNNAINVSVTTDALFPINNTGANQIVLFNSLTLLTSPTGMSWIAVMLLTSFIAVKLDESLMDVSIFFFGIVSGMLGLLNVYPSGLGFLTAIFSISLLLLKGDSKSSHSFIHLKSKRLKNNV